MEMTKARVVRLGLAGVALTTLAYVAHPAAPIAGLTLRAHDGAHFVTAELDTTVNATRTVPGPWEELAAERQADGSYAFRTWQGWYWSAQPDGTLEANRPEVHAWEQFRAVAAADGATCLQSAHGTFVVAEGGGGGTVRVDRTACGPWEGFHPSKPLNGGPGPTPGPPVALGALAVQDNFRYFATFGARGDRYDLREISSFALVSRVLRGEAESHVRPLVREYRAQRFTQVRVILTLDGDYWANPNQPGAAQAIGYSLRSAPDMPGFWDALHAVARITAEEGLYVRFVILGALEPFGGQWDSIARRDIFQGEVRRKAREFAHEVARQVAIYPHVLLEIANEPAAIGMRDSAKAIGDLTCEVKAIAPMAMVNSGDIAGMEPVAEMYRCADYVDEHGPRDGGLDGIEAAKRWGEVRVRDQQVRAVPAMSGEPANACEPRLDGRGGGWDQVLREPIAQYAYAAVMRVRQINPNFHYDGGLYSLPLRPETRACAEAFHAGLDAIPMLTGNRWRGHWGLGQGDYWSDRLWADTDVPREIEDWVRRGRGAWRAFGLNEWSVLFPTTPTFDWRPHLEAPADRTSFMANSRFAVGIFRRH